MATVPAPDDDVEKLLTGIMSRNSPLMKQARYQGQAGAQAAGLGQSTMGIKAAQAAAYNAALPIASQQAQQGFQKNMQTSEFEQQTGMQGRQFGHETGMQTSGFQHAASQADLDRAQQLNVTRESAYLDRLKMHEASNLERGTLAIQQQHEAALKAQDMALQERIAGMELSGADKERALSAVTAANNAWSQAYSTIASNPDLPADARNNMLATVDGMRQHSQNLTTSLYRNTVPW